MHNLIPLHLLAPGQIGHIDQLLGCPDQVHRLEELGLRPGSAVEMVQTGSPCIIKIGGSKLCFRDSDLLSVLVQAGAIA